MIYILLYVISVFIARYFDVKVKFYIHRIYYKNKINYTYWFIPGFNIVYPLMVFIDYRIMIYNKSKWFNWFFVKYEYRLKKERELLKDFEREFNGNIEDHNYFNDLCNKKNNIIN
jgi:hypothetical protein